MAVYSKPERETSIIFDDEERVAHIYTAIQTYIRKLDKLCAEHPETYKRVWSEWDADQQKITAARYECKSKYIRFGRPPTQAAIERGRRIHQMKPGNATEE